MARDDSTHTETTTVYRPDLIEKGGQHAVETPERPVAAATPPSPPPAPKKNDNA